MTGGPERGIPASSRPSGPSGSSAGLASSWSEPRAGAQPLPGQPSSAPPPSEPRLQQALVGALLVGLVGDVGQVDAPEGRTVLQYHVAHAEAEDIRLQPLLQVLQEPERAARGQGRGQEETPEVGAQPAAGWLPDSPGGRATASPLAGALDLGQFGEQPLLVLCPQALTQLGRA